MGRIKKKSEFKILSTYLARNSADGTSSTGDGTRLIEKYHKSGPEDGIFQIKWPNGNLRYEWTYKDGKRVDGISRGWWENGQKKHYQSWLNGLEHGLENEWWSITGVIPEEENFQISYYDEDSKSFKIRPISISDSMKKGEYKWKQGTKVGKEINWYDPQLSHYPSKMYAKIRQFRSIPDEIEYKSVLVSQVSSVVVCGAGGGEIKYDICGEEADSITFK